MDIRQCARCSRLFQSRGSSNCPACVHKLDEIFLNVRNFLDGNPRVSIEDVCEACGAEEGDVLRWLREGRLILSGGNVPLLTCQLCQTPIHSGRYCDDCAVRIVGQLEDTARHLGNRGDARDGPGAKRGHGGDGRVHVQVSE